MTRPAADQTLSPLDWTFLIALSILWGGSFLCGRIAVQEIPPLSLVELRVGLAALTLWLVLAVLRQRMRHDRWQQFAVMGLLNNIVPFGLIFFGQIEIGAGLAAVINGMTPFWAALMARVTGVEALSPRKLLGVLTGFAGLAVTVGPAALDGLDASLIGQIAVVGATISYGCAGIYGRRFKDLPPLVSATGQLTASALLVLPAALLIDRPWTLAAPTTETWIAVGALAVLATALAYILFFRVLASAGATNVMLVTLMVPPSAIVLGVLVLGETILARQIAGMALIALGLSVIDGRLWRALLARERPAGTG